MNLNKVFILGNLTRNPEKRSLPSGQPIVSFGMATNRFYTPQGGEKRQETEFHNVTIFGRLAEIASQYLQKGSLVLIEGRLRTRSWQDSSGVKHFRTEIIAENLQLGPRTGINSQKSQNSQNSQIGATNFKKEPVIENTVKNEHIPIIEEKSPETNPKNEDTGEVDVKEIPF